MCNILFILSHYDDEFGLFNVIEKYKNTHNRVFILYLTNGLTKNNYNDKKKQLKRERESIKILIKLGVKKKNIIFLGKKIKIPVYCLYQNLKILMKNLENFIKNIKGTSIIYTHAWEGGNEDHDACYILVKKLLLINNNVKKAFQFSQYHRHKVLFFPYKIQSLIPSKSKEFKTKISFFTKIRYISYLFNYISQSYLWLPIYPFIILKILTNNYGNVKIIPKKVNFKKPHNGLLLYEKMRNNKYKHLKLFFSKFLQSKIHQNPNK